jgi:hypothetical protein
MYTTPALTKFGTLREITKGAFHSKSVIGDDMIPGIGLDCNPNAHPGDPTGCIRS